MRNIESELWRQHRARVEWMEDPQPLEAPPPQAGRLWYVVGEDALELSASLGEPRSSLTSGPCSDASCGASGGWTIS